MIERGVYLIRMDRWYKIGWSTKMTRRLYSLNIQLPQPIEVLWLLEVAGIGRSETIERILHERYAHRRTRGEWFELADEERDEIMALKVEDFVPKPIEIRALMTPERIRRLRRILCMSFAEFAVALDVSENCARRWEIGDRHPKYRTMERMYVMAQDLPAKLHREAWAG